MVWELEIEGVGILKEKELEKFLEEKRERKEPFVMLVKGLDGKKYRIKVGYEEFERLIYPEFVTVRMFSLRLLLNDGRELFLRNCEYWFDVPYSLLSAREIIIGDGYVRNYGNEDDISPLDVFKEKHCFKRCIYPNGKEKCYEQCYSKKLLKYMVWFGYNEKKKIWFFGGNYEEYSGAFSFLIWNKDLARKVWEKLREVGFEFEWVE